MAYTFLACYTEVSTNFDTVALSSGRVKTWTNDAVSEICSMRRWSWLETLGTFASVSGQADYILVGSSPVVPDFDSPISLRHNQAAAGTTLPKLNFMKQDAFDELVGAAGATPGIPIFYTIRGGAGASTSGSVLAGGNQTLSVWPVPNFIGSFKLAYFRSTDGIEMVSDADIPLPPPRFRQAICDLALAIGKSRTDQLIASNVAEQRAETALGKLVQADIVARAGHPESAIQLPQNPPVASPPNTPYGWAQGDAA